MVKIVITVSCRQKDLDAIASAENGPKSRIVDDDDLPKLAEGVNRQCVYERQRWNMFVFAMRTGYRPETLQRLKWKAFEQGTRDGRKYIKPIVGTQKNHQADYEHLDAGLLEQYVLASEDSR
jgi:hypothetical protein